MQNSIQNDLWNANVVMVFWNERSNHTSGNGNKHHYVYFQYYNISNTLPVLIQYFKCNVRNNSPLRGSYSKYLQHYSARSTTKAVLSSPHSQQHNMFRACLQQPNVTSMIDMYMYKYPSDAILLIINMFNWWH